MNPSTFDFHPVSKSNEINPFGFLYSVDKSLFTIAYLFHKTFYYETEFLKFTANWQRSFKSWSRIIIFHYSNIVDGRPNRDILFSKMAYSAVCMAISLSLSLFFQVEKNKKKTTLAHAGISD